MTNKTDKQTDEAKRQNEEAKRKVKHEEKQAAWTSPEQMQKEGEVTPTQQVVPNQPQPENNDAYVNTRYDGNGGKGE